MTPFSPSADSDETLARKRDSLLLIAQMRIGDDAHVHDVRVRNLSEGGLMAEWDQPVVLGAAVTTELRGVGKVAGRVVWSEQGRIGVAFDRAIDPKAARKPVGGGTKTASYAKAPPRR